MAPTCKHCGQPMKFGRLAVYDREYVKKRDDLIPIAEAYADKKHPEPVDTKKGAGNRDKEREKYAADWNATYHGKMDALARQAGLI